MSGRMPKGLCVCSVEFSRTQGENLTGAAWVNGGGMLGARRAFMVYRSELGNERRTESMFVCWWRVVSPCRSYTSSIQIRARNVL
jgi:hypothetical protein